jgi:hypothetical protein
MFQTCDLDPKIQGKETLLYIYIYIYIYICLNAMIENIKIRKKILDIIKISKFIQLVNFIHHKILIIFFYFECF